MLFQIQQASSSLFNGHSLQPENLIPSVHHSNYQYWISWLLIACFAAVVWIMASNRKKLSLVISAAISNRNVEQLIRNEYALSNRLSVALSALFLIITTIFIYQTNYHFGWIKTSISEPAILFGKILATLVIFFTLKFILIWAVGLIFDRQQESFLHIFNIFLFNETIGIFIFPAVVFIQYASTGMGAFLLYVLTGFFTVGYLTKFARLLFLGAGNKGISKTHLFLYLCTLEILPLVVIIKLFVGRI